jgi:predicted RNase H-like HicB family nuclease
MTYTVLLEGGDDGWGGIVPDLPGLLVLGDTRDDVIAQAPDVIADYLDALRDDGDPIPKPSMIPTPPNGRLAVNITVRV